MSSTKLESDLASADLTQSLALAQKAREKVFAAIVRFVRRREASGPATNMMEQIRRDRQLCKLLVEYESESEIIVIIEFTLDLKMNPSGKNVSKSTDRNTK